jgi:hypothetical protein
MFDRCASEVLMDNGLWGLWIRGRGLMDKCGRLNQQFMDEDGVQW